MPPHVVNRFTSRIDAVRTGRFSTPGFANGGMDPRRRYQVGNLAIFVVAIAHALLTWPLRETAALFAGGVVIAFVGEVAVVRAELVEHELRPKIAGVPVSILLVWPAVVYAFYRVALLVAPGELHAAAVAAVLATALDVLTDPNGVREGVWRYPEHPLSEPRFRGVPWWNFAGWLVVVFLTAMVAVMVGG